MEKCATCGRQIQDDEQAFVWNNDAICHDCYSKVMAECREVMAEGNISLPKRLWKFACNRSARAAIFARSRPAYAAIIAAALVLLIVWGTWEIFGPAIAWYPNTAKIGNVEVGIWKLENFYNEAILVLRVVNDSGDKKLDLNFGAVSVKDESGNEYKIKAIRGENGTDQARTSLYPGYILKTPIVLEKLLDKDIEINLSSDFYLGAKPIVLKISRYDTDTYNNNFVIQDIDWGMPAPGTAVSSGTVSVPNAGTVVTFYKNGNNITVGCKMPTKIPPSKVMYYSLYLYDNDERVIGYADSFDFTHDFKFLLSPSRGKAIKDAVKFRIDIVDWPK